MKTFKSRNVWFMLWMMPFVLGLKTAIVVAQGAQPRTMEISCTAPNPAAQNGLRRVRGDGNTWVFSLSLVGDARMISGPTWSYPGKGATNPDWGTWAGGDGSNSLSWTSPQKTGNFDVSVSGKIRCGKGGAGGQGQDISFGASWSGEVKDVEVKFNPKTVKVGFVLSDESEEQAANIGKKTVTATVNPASEADKINLVVTGANRASVSNVKPDTKAGTISFDVKGTSATPANVPDGDTTIEAQLNGVSKGKMQVVVVVPASIQQPIPTFDGDVTGVNMALGGTSVPPLYLGPGQPWPAGYASLRTVWQTVQTITVLDQFGQVLDGLYEGASITETDPLNVRLSGNGTYEDHVGRPEKKPGGHTVRDPSPQKDAWLAPGAPLILPAEIAETAIVPVQVGGHSVGAFMRTVTITLIPGQSSKVHLKIE